MTANNSKEEKSRERELEKKIFDNSPILRNSPRPIEIYEEKGNLAKKSLFFLPSFLTKKLNKKFVYLTKKVFLPIDPDVPPGWFDWQGVEFRERANKNEKVREKIENICAKEFAHDLEKKYLVEGLCGEIGHQSESIKDFKELEIEDPQPFFKNLFKYIDKLGDAKDTLIIADRKTYRFIKQNESGKFLESYVGNLLEIDLENNNTKLIITSQKGLLIPYSVERFNYENTHYLKIHYEIDLMDNNPIIIFKEEPSDKNAI